MPTSQGGPRGFEMRDPEQPDESPQKEGRTRAERPLPPTNFTTLVLSLSTSAMVHLGVGPAPEGEEKPQRNLALARQTIDILEILQEKTRGNLDPDESRVLEAVLHDLRMAYVAK